METTVANIKRLGALLKCRPGTNGAGMTGRVVKVEDKGVRVSWSDGRTEYLHLAERWALKCIEVVR
jgi:hypothetical protein